MVGFANMHEVLFRHFGGKGVLSNKEGQAMEVDVILRFGVDDIDEFNEVVERVDKVSFKASQVGSLKGQTLTVATGEFTGKYDLGRKLRSNGYMESRELVRLSDA